MTEADANILLQQAAEQIPSLTECLACLDCERMFRTGDACPYCTSKSAMNIADILGTENIYQKMQESRK